MYLFNKTFFKFAFGFLAIIAASFILVNMLASPLQETQPQNLRSAPDTN